MSDGHGGKNNIVHVRNCDNNVFEALKMDASVSSALLDDCWIFTNVFYSF